MTEAAKLEQRYDREGFVSPIAVVTGHEAAGMRERLEAYLSRAAKNPKDDPLMQYKVHMVFPWADRLIRHPAALDAVEALIGPDILVWNTAVLIKQPGTRDFVSWHQDAYYWGNHPDHVVSGWIAVCDSTPDNGCVRVIPGSHTPGILPHADTFGADNMLSRGQRITEPMDDGKAVDLVLKAGEMSLHHTRTVHSSHPNRSAGPRIGLVVTFMSPATVMNGPRTGATLVRGRDTHGHFDLESVRPSVDLDPEGLAAHDEAMRPFSQSIFEGAEDKARLAQGRARK